MRQMKLTTAALALMAAPVFAYESVTTEADAQAQAGVIPSQATNATQYDAQNDADRAAALPEMGGETRSESEMADLNTDFDIAGWSEINAPLTAEELTGMPLYDTADTWIGEIDQVIVNDSGTMEGVVLGVGGVLGIGEHDVLVSFDSLKIKHADGGDDVRAYVDVTKEALEAMPRYES